MLWACVLFALLTCTLSQVLYTTTGRPGATICDGNSTTCYGQIFVPNAMNMVPTSYNQRFHIADTLTYKELCRDARALSLKVQNASRTTFTCLNYFSSESMISVIANAGIAYRPTTFQGVASVYIMTWWAPHFDLMNYCYYCNHSTRDEFLQKVDNYEMKYFWKHSRNVGNDGSNSAENPTLMAKVHLQYINWFRDQPDRQGILDGRDPQRNLTDFLLLTERRNFYRDEIGEENREEYHYNIFCSSWNLWGTKCDSYVWFWNPFRYSFWPIMDYINRIVLLIVTLVLLWIPRMNFHFRTYLTDIRQTPRFLYELVADVKLHTVLFITIGIAFTIVEDSADFKTTQGAFHSWRGVFRVIGGASTSLAFLSLLVFWSHIYHSAQAMGDRMNIWNKLTLGVFYASILVMLVVAAILYGVIADHRPYLFLSLICFACVYFLFLTFGFLIHGLRMFLMLKKSNQVNFLKLKFTKFMLLIIVLFIHYIGWSIVMAVEFAIPGNMSLFIVLMRGPLMDVSSLILYPFVIYMLFEPGKFFVIWPFGTIRDRLKDLKGGKYHRQKDVNNRDAKLKTSLITDEEASNKRPQI